MSRKSKRNQHDPASPPPQAPVAPPPGSADRRRLFIATGAGLLLAFGAGTLWYRSQQARSSQLAAATNQPALASAQSPSFGKAEARVHIVEFVDPACETCAAFFPHVKKLLSAHPDRIRLSVRHLPLHQGSDQVVRMLEAARNQGQYLRVLETLYAAQAQWVVQHVVQADRVWNSLAGLGLDLERLRSDMNAPEVTRRIEQDIGDARILGVTKTPGFFVNGRPLPSFGLEQLQTLVREELGRAYP